MDQTTPPSDSRAPGSPGPRSPRRVRGSWAIAAAVALCAVGLGAGINAVAQAHSTAAGQTAGPAPSTAAPASAPSAIVAELEAEINAVIDANSDYQVGVAVVDVSDGADPAAVHEYGVQAPFVAASNTLTPAEMARILGGLYSGTLLGPADTAQLLSYMQDTNKGWLVKK